jgi:hypothetical protein
MPDVQTKGFKRAVAKMLQGECKHAEMCEDAGCGCPCVTTADGVSVEDLLDGAVECLCHARCNGECEIVEQAKAIIGGIVPDAFHIGRNNGGDPHFRSDVVFVTVYEVEDTSAINEHKMRAYLDLWWLLDATDGYELQVVVLDRYGRETVLDLAALPFAEMLDSQAAEVKA